MSRTSVGRCVARASCPCSSPTAWKAMPRAGARVGRGTGILPVLLPHGLEGRATSGRQVGRGTGILPVLLPHGLEGRATTARSVDPGQETRQSKIDATLYAQRRGSSALCLPGLGNAGEAAGRPGRRRAGTLSDPIRAGRSGTGRTAAAESGRTRPLRYPAMSPFTSRTFRSAPSPDASPDPGRAVCWSGLGKPTLEPPDPSSGRSIPEVLR